MAAGDGRHLEGTSESDSELQELKFGVTSCGQNICRYRHSSVISWSDPGWRARRGAVAVGGPVHRPRHRLRLQHAVRDGEAGLGAGARPATVLPPHQAPPPSL